MKTKSIYICSFCGHQEAKWIGKCPSCQKWDSMKEQTLDSNKGSQSRTGNRVEAVRLQNVAGSNSDRITTNINEFNRVMGGGIVKDSVTIITSPPGGGKSTLVLAIASDLTDQKLTVLYVSGEESESQIKSRANRILKDINENLWILSDTSMDNVLTSIE
ncbi:MAG: AAA family ATPase, partial [Clostridiales bacterium]|nr:AAA family ATPase [Clostridiales bacterium]